MADIKFIGKTVVLYAIIVFVSILTVTSMLSFMVIDGASRSAYLKEYVTSVDWEARKQQFILNNGNISDTATLEHTLISDAGADERIIDFEEYFNKNYETYKEQINENADILGDKAVKTMLEGIDSEFFRLVTAKRYGELVELLNNNQDFYHFIGHIYEDYKEDLNVDSINIEDEEKVIADYKEDNLWFIADSDIVDNLTDGYVKYLKLREALMGTIDVSDEMIKSAYEEYIISDLSNIDTLEVKTWAVGGTVFELSRPEVGYLFGAHDFTINKNTSEPVNGVSKLWKTTDKAKSVLERFGTIATDDINYYDVKLKEKVPNKVYEVLKNNTGSNSITINVTDLLKTDDINELMKSEEFKARKEEASKVKYKTLLDTPCYMEFLIDENDSKSGFYIILDVLKCSRKEVENLGDIKDKIELDVKRYSADNIIKELIQAEKEEH